MYFLFVNDTSIELFKEEILKVDSFARMIGAKGYGWMGFRALDLCYGYRTMYRHLKEEDRRQKVVRDVYRKKPFPGWDTEEMAEAIATYTDIQQDNEMDSYIICEEQIAATNTYIQSLELTVATDGIKVTDEGDIVDSSDTMEKLKLAYDLQEKQYKIRKMLRDSLLGKLSDKGSKIKGDKEVTWLERVNNEQRKIRAEQKKKGAEQPNTPLLEEESK